MTLYEVIKELQKAGHEEIWITTSDDCKSYYKDPIFPGSWLHPKIVSRDGRVIAHRIAKPNGWSLCGDWTNTLVRPHCAPPYQAVSLKGQLSAMREKTVLDATLPSGDDTRDKTRL
ncbi:hypothetical protein AB6H28_23505 [Enterobacter cloacae]|uniref:hypothetical protein n=1 Tax=Enterobacter cloacae TaxID=550 RepID=UPI0034DCC78D